MDVLTTTLQGFEVGTPLVRVLQKKAFFLFIKI